MEDNRTDFIYISFDKKRRKYIVPYCGDSVAFDTPEEAERFIDSIISSLTEEDKEENPLTSL